MSGAGYSVHGTANVAAALDELGRNGSDVTIPAGQVVAIGRDAARAAAPVRLGRLAGSIEASSDPSGGSIACSIDYGPYQEFGTRYVSAQRFMAAGHDAMDAAAADPFERHLATVVADAQKG